MKQSRCPEGNRHLVKKICNLTEAAEEAADYIGQYLSNDFSGQFGFDDHASYIKKYEEIQQYFMTGNCGKGNSEAASANPTFLNPKTGSWSLTNEACPYHGYLPLPVEEVNAKNAMHGVIADYCRTELKKLLIAFRHRMEKIMFYFHPCDALAFCYGDLPYKFDIIDTWLGQDSLGLANLLNAASRKLISDQSLLFTESIQWSGVAPSLAKYVQEILFCPLSLIPTLYGLRLMDNVELGPEEPRSTFCTMVVMSMRLRWKKTMPFDQVPLVLTTPLINALQRLMDACSINPSIASAHLIFTKSCASSSRR